MSELIATDTGIFLILTLIGIILCYKLKYVKILWFGWVTSYLIYDYLYRQANEQYFRVDFRSIYRWVALGDASDFVYKGFTATYWKPFVLFPYETAFVLWYALQAVFVLYLVMKLLEIKHGWILIYPYLKIVGWSMGTGNVTASLATLCISPAGALFAITVKPYLFLIYCLTVWKTELRWVWISLGLMVCILSLPSPSNPAAQHPLAFIGLCHTVYFFTIFLILRKWKWIENNKQIAKIIHGFGGYPPINEEKKGYV
jgi:hypothetical protein